MVCHEPASKDDGFFAADSGGRIPEAGIEKHPPRWGLDMFHRKIVPSC
ncbi:hypothetical protein SAMN05216233_111167 [Desulfoluna spongiiphila]|uniref:Uncharacterized protein n=1 Tax=Desulfoluna spongiiphila TaxID=419481 RepID=A0A1G5GVD1_9BACT|nr:hypothetical protein SAMN05216233_111167 [Desulfoluna spongiiphila]VVS92940.1 consensus disorder prediction [Desulfoluna spongiiphila]